MAEAKVTTRLDPSGFHAGINGMNRSVSRLSSTLSAAKGALIGFVSVGAITRASRAVIDFGSEVYHSALQAGVGVERYQALAKMYEHAGSNAGVLARTLQRLTSMQARAMGGDKTALRGGR